MEWIIFFLVVVALVIVFVFLQLVAVLFLLDENKRIHEELEKNSPPF
jgi:hypothetical protein